jgi:hypothetical protein
MRSVSTRTPKNRPWKTRWSDTAPTERERLLLQLIARHGGLRVTCRSSGRQFICEDGTALRAGSYRPFSNSDLTKFAELGWLTPDPDAPALIPLAVAQRYFAVLS